MSVPDGRPRGEWRQTPWLLRILGWPDFQRSIYAHEMIGGGWDGWEYSPTLPAAHTASKSGRRLHERA